MVTLPFSSIRLLKSRWNDDRVYSSRTTICLVRYPAGMQFNTSQIALPVHLVWDRPYVEPSKHHWDLFEKLMPPYSYQIKFNNRCGLPMQEHFGSLTVIPKDVVLQTRWKNAFIEPLEPDDSDEECVPHRSFLTFRHIQLYMQKESTSSDMHLRLFYFNIITSMLLTFTHLSRHFY
jgi:hypothetical protein